MQKLSIIGMTIICISISFLEMGCTNFPFFKDEPNQNKINNNEGTTPQRPVEPQDPSLIVTGRYSGIDDSGEICTVSIKKTNNKKFPFTIHTNTNDKSTNRKNLKWEEDCYQNKNTLICFNEHVPDFYFIVTQNSNKEIEITDFSYKLAFSGSGVGDCNLCTGSFTKK